MSMHRMSEEARVVYVERRMEDRERTTQRRSERQAAAWAHGGQR